MRTLLSVFLLALLATSLASADRPAADSVADLPLERITAISREIDRRVNAHLASLNLKPNPLADDATFLRRIHLGIAGRIPTLDETTAFLESNEPNKRALLIDRLLDSDGYVSHHFNFWADLLRVKSRLPGGITGQPYIDFIKRSLADNQPYGDFVREMLASEGHSLGRGNGATGYYLRDRGMPEDNMANTARVFLGTRLECAQCHDHPFAKWTQRDFFEMVAFTNGIATERGPSLKMRKELLKVQVDPEVRSLASQMLLQMPYGVYGGGSGVRRLPENYQYGNGSPNELVTAKTLFGKRELTGHSTNLREEPTGPRFVFANWLTSPDNPRFTKVIANRLWSKAMGRGLIEPIDDITAETVPSNPQLLEFLSESMIDLGFDMKQFLRAIYNSKTYQRLSVDGVITEAGSYHFQGPLLRRMSAEQLWDSFITLVVPDPDQRGNPREAASRSVFGKDLYDGFEQVKTMTLEEILDFAQKEVEIRTAMRDPGRVRRQNEELRMPGKRTVEEVDELQRRVAKLKLMAALNPRDPARASWSREIQELTVRLNHIPAQISPDLVRASELPSPAPPSHFLRQFGQSDREQIDHANTEPAVSQVLTLMNGQIEKWILSNPQTVLMYRTATAADPLEAVYLSMVSRRPTPAERSIWLDLGDQVREEAVEDLIWTLANTTEFLFIR